VTRGRPAVLALLPALGGSLGGLARHGQLDRLLEYYFPAYLEHFDRLRYFSYEPERLEAFTGDPELRRRIDVVAPTRRAQRHVRAVLLARGVSGRLLRDSALARAFQAPGALPGAIAGARYVCTYGYSYARFTRAPVPGALTRITVAPKRAAIRASLRFVLTRAVSTIVTSSDGAREARALGARRIEWIPNGVDVQAFAPRDEEAEYDATYVGQLVPRKDVQALVAAVALARSRVRLCLVGAGPELDRLRASCIAEKVDATFLGPLPNREVARILGRSRCFVLPSRDEGHPKALLEALAAGLPCIAADIPAVRELASEGLVLTFAPGDARELARILDRVLSDGPLRETLGRQGRAAAEERFDLRRLVAEEAELLARLARER
jgi:glycosyltransferase involved in cell wall biosynthesis